MTNIIAQGNMGFAMRNFILVMFLFGMSGSAAAEWVAVSVNTDHTITTYVDPATVRTSGAIAKIWVLHDFNTIHRDLPNDTPYLSMKSLEEISCNEKTGRSLYSSEHTGNMGNGNTELPSVFRLPRPWS